MPFQFTTSQVNIVYLSRHNSLIGLITRAYVYFCRKENSVCKFKEIHNNLNFHSNAKIIIKICQ